MAAYPLKLLNFNLLYFIKTCEQLNEFIHFVLSCSCEPLGSFDISISASWNKLLLL